MKKLTKIGVLVSDNVTKISVSPCAFFYFLFSCFDFLLSIFLVRSRQNVRITVSCFKTSSQNNGN